MCTTKTDQLKSTTNNTIEGKTKITEISDKVPMINENHGTEIEENYTYENCTHEWHTIDETFGDYENNETHHSNIESIIKYKHVDSRENDQKQLHHEIQKKKIQNNVKENNIRMIQILDKFNQITSNAQVRNSDQLSPETGKSQNSCNIDTDINIEQHMESNIKQTNNQTNNQKQPQIKKIKYEKIFMYGDSHCIGLQTILENLIPDNCQINVSSNPGMGIAKIVDQLDCTDIGPNDLVCIMAGTNDLFWTDWLDMETSYVELQRKCKNTNLLVIFLPPMYDKKTHQ